MHSLQAINSDISVLVVCNKTGGTIKGDIKKNEIVSMISGPCHHGLTRPQVAGGGTASRVEGNCEYIE